MEGPHATYVTLKPKTIPPVFGMLVWDRLALWKVSEILMTFTAIPNLQMHLHSARSALIVWTDWA
jgi:hypothetical protein